ETRAARRKILDRTRERDSEGCCESSVVLRDQVCGTGRTDHRRVGFRLDRHGLNYFCSFVSCLLDGSGFASSFFLRSPSGMISNLRYAPVPRLLVVNHGSSSRAACTTRRSAAFNGSTVTVFLC